MTTARPRTQGPGRQLTAPIVHAIRRHPRSRSRSAMTMPLSNSQTRDIEALLHPYADAIALQAALDAAEAWARAEGHLN